MEGRERHTHARTQCRRRRRRALGPTVMTRGEDTCVRANGSRAIDLFHLIVGFRCISSQGAISGLSIIRSFSKLLASKNELCTSVQRAFVYLRKPLCRRKPGTCRPGWLASRAQTVSTAASGPHPKNHPPPSPHLLSQHTHTHARTHTLPSTQKSETNLGACLPACPPGDVMTRGEGTCVSSEGTCACARASLLACAKHGASSTTVYKKRWRVFIINEFLDIRFTHPRQ